MRKRPMLLFLLAGVIALSLFVPVAAASENNEAENNEKEDSLPSSNDDDLLSLTKVIFGRFIYDDSGVEIEYPEEGVKGVYATAQSMEGEKAEYLLNLVKNTALNSLVVDVKDDHGHVTFQTESKDERVQENTHEYISDLDGMMEKFEESEIYPIARIVVFKDTVLANQEPELSFLDNGEVWSNSSGDSFVNPFNKEVWKYNVEIAKEAAKAGFKEIQFDYVRFSEGFENRDEDLSYTEGDYAESGENNIQNRVAAVTDFVEYAREELRPYGVGVSVDIFGYAADVPETPGIGQNFSKISEHVDVISSMIYPSHWGPGYFDIAYPDLEPYNLVDAYMQVEKEVLGELEDPPTSRPWIQDFTASYLPNSQWQRYGADEVEAQIQALYNNGVDEFLLWNGANNYTEGVDYELDAEQDHSEEK